ncbi:MAG: recombinase family protein [Candidatus Caenarcaniphilales bacterium]|nr:recombinase family protein [Candidatus Caenarcaniphilales bacterium]
MKVALYVRKSSEDSSKQIQSIENQLEILKAKAKKEDLKIIEIYQESKSAKKPYKREAFNKMLADLQDRKFEAILCWKLDRLSRNPIEGGIIQHLLLEGSLSQIITYERRYYPSDNSLMMNMELGMAAEYSLALGKNVKRGMNFKVDKGVYPNTAPLGYLNITKPNGEKTIELDPERAPIVQKLWRMLLSGNTVMGELVEQAASMGLRTRASANTPEKKVSRHGLHCIFSNPFYYGMFRWANELHHGTHSTMVTKEEFDKAQKIISAKKCAPRKAKYKFPLKGFITCGECGASVTAEHKNKKRADGSIHHRIYYRCTHRRKDYDCKQPMIIEAELEEQIIELLDSIKINKAFVSWVKKWLVDFSQEQSEKQKTIREIQKNQLNKIDNQIERLLEMRINEEIDAELFKIKKDNLVLDKKAIEKEMSVNTDMDDSRIDTTVEILDFCKQAKYLFENGDYNDKQLVLNTLGSRLYLKDKKLRVELAKPFQLIQDSVSQEWVLNPRFTTLKTKTSQGDDTLTRSLIDNGATDGI